MPYPVASCRSKNASGAASPLLTSLSAYYKLSDTSDSAGSSTLTNNAGVTFVAGKQGNAGQFVATDGKYLSCVSNSALQTGDIDFTLAGWLYLDSKTANRGIVSRDTGSNPDREYILIYQSSTDRFLFRTMPTGTTVSVLADALGSPSLSTWYFLVAWHDSVADTINIQVNNGSVNSTATGNLGPPATSAGFSLGAQTATGSNAFDGKLDEWGYWKRVLTSEERAALYNAGNGVTYPSFA